MAFITDLKQNDTKLKEWLENVKVTQRENPDLNFSRLEYGSIYDLLIPYKDMVARTKNFDELGVVKDTIPVETIDNVFISGLNWDYKFDELSDYKVNDTLFYDYGVCDNASQLLEYAKKNTDKDKDYILVMTPFGRETEPAEGGWRWHKWGQYIGVQNPRFEYLADEEDIDIIHTFNIMEVVLNKENS